MPILQKRKVHFAKNAKTCGMKKIKLDENLANNSSSDSESEDETFKNKISSKENKNKVSKVTEKLKTPGKKKVSQVQKYTSSSESESENEIAKNKTSSKGKNIPKVPEVPKTSKCLSSESESEDETPKTKTSPEKQELLKNGSPKKCFDFPTSLSADGGSKNSKESSRKNLELTRSDSDEPPLVIDEDGDNDLLGLQKYMKDELKLNISSPTKAKLNHDAPQSIPNKNSNNVGSSSESESDIEGTQETKNANNCRQIKINMNKKLNNASSESESDSEKIKNRDSEKDANFKENVNKNSSSVDSESDSDIEGTQEILNKKSYKKVADSPKKYTNENVNTVISQSEYASDVDATQKPGKTKNDDKDVKTKSNTNKMSNVTLESEFESDVEKTQKPVKLKNDSKDVKTKSNMNKMSNITSESESDSGEKQETKIIKNVKKIGFKIEQVINQVSKVVTSESESDEETQETESKSKCILGEETNINLNEQSNLNTSETQFDEQGTQKAIKSECHSPRINYDLQMLSKVNKANDSENSDFELTLESGASHEEKEPASSDADSKKSKVSSDTIKKTSASRKKKVSLSKKAPSPVDERMRDSNDSAPENKLSSENGSLHEDKELASTDIDSKKEAVVNGKLKKTKKETYTSPRKAPLPVAEVKSENELASENGSLHEDKELASTDTDSKKEAVVNGKLKRTKKKTRTSPRKAPLPEAQVKSENEFASENGSSHEDEDQASRNTDEETSKTKSKLKKASDSKKKNLNSPEKAPAPSVPSVPAFPAVVEARHELEPESGEDEVSSDDSADEEEDLNESLLHSTEPMYRPTVEEKRILANIEIKIKHRVLPQHQVESTAGTRTLKQREKDEFEKYATLKRGTFDSTEDKQIKKNWKIFCKNHDWNPKNPKPFLFMKIKNKEALMSQVNRKRFMQILAHGLPNRSLYSVFQRFKNLYDPHRTCRYTEDEDRVIVDFISTYNAVDEKDRKFAELATILKRTRASVWRRYRVLKKKQLLRINDGLCHSNR